MSSVSEVPFPIGTPGTPWGAPERAQWRASQKKLRSYADEVAGGGYRELALA